MSIRDVITIYARGLITLTVLGIYLSHVVDTGDRVPRLKDESLPLLTRSQTKCPPLEDDNYYDDFYGSGDSVDCMDINTNVCNGTHYGPNCAVTCNCLLTRDCQSDGTCCCFGCQYGWSGTTCQIRNFARGASVWMSSTLESTWRAEKAVDGVTSGADEYCAHTDNGDQNPRLRVDLGQQQTVYAMRFRNRESCCTAGMNNFEVYVSNGEGYDDNRRLCYRRETSVEKLVWVYFTCNQPMYGRYVWIQSTKLNLTICQMEIYECSHFTFGPDCDDYCNCANADEVCHTVTGACVSGCAKGYHGTDCMQECRPGHFGYNCTKQCHCFLESDVCNRISGECLSGCGLGYSGDGCQEECPNGFYGQGCRGNCSEQCGVVSSSERLCNHETGACTNCRPGYIGTNRDEHLALRTEGDDSSLHGGIIAGIAIGCLLGIALIAALVVIYKLRRKMLKFTTPQSSHIPAPAQPTYQDQVHTIDLNPSQGTTEEASVDVEGAEYCEIIEGDPEHSGIVNFQKDATMYEIPHTYHNVDPIQK